MSFEVKIPAVGESITSGLLSIWHQEDGSNVAEGALLFTLETDKVSSEIAAEKAGILRIKAPAGSEVKIGETVAVIEDSASGPAQTSDDRSDARSSGAKTEPPAKEKPKAPGVAEAGSPPAGAASPAADRGGQAPAAGAPPAPQPDQPAPAPGEAPAPAASGEAPAEPSVPAPTSEPAPAAPRAAEGRSTRRKLSPLRRKIAAQLVMAQHTAAILTTFNEADMSAVMKLRSEMQEAFTKEHGVKLGFMSFFLKAVVSALQAVPAINGRMEGEELVQNHFYDIGVAVGSERGLVVPVIRDADKKSFAELERALAGFASKAREGKIKIEDLSGGVFTISNGGIYGSLLSTPILNPPQSGILGMHKIQERPIAENGQVVIRPMMYLALSYDHRVVDGKEAVTFLVRVKECLENPARLLLGL